MALRFGAFHVMERRMSPRNARHTGLRSARDRFVATRRHRWPLSAGSRFAFPRFAVGAQVASVTMPGRVPPRGIDEPAAIGNVLDKVF